MNYKIGITEENQAIVKRIANENGMNPYLYAFLNFGIFYNIVDNKFDNIIGSDYTEISTEQFIQLFDKKETELDKWLGETKAKNLSLEELKNYVFSLCNYNQNIYTNLKGEFAKDKAQILFNQWNNPTEESPKVEAEWQPKETLEDAAEKEYGESKNNLVSDLDKIMYKCYMSGVDFGAKWQSEQPKETDFKTKVIELIDDIILERTENIANNLKGEYYGLAHTNKQKRKEAQYILNQIKQL
jgi:hypothetical protein